MSENGYKHIGKPRPLVDGLEKVTGHARYVTDLRLPGMLYGRLILSPHAHARIGAIDCAAALAQPGVVAVLTADDLPTRHVTATSRNSAILAREVVRWAGQPVAVVVAESAQQAADAADLVLIDYEPLPAVTDLEAAVQANAPQVWPNGLPTSDGDMSSLHAQTVAGRAAAGEQLNNVSKENHYARGDVAAGLAAADIVLTRTYRTHHLHQMYLEPHAVVAEPQPLGRGVTLYTSTQGQFYVRDEVAELLKLPESRVTVQSMTVGGGFGAKYGILEPLAAAVALAVGRPVQIALARSEDFLSTTPAPATIIELTTGASTAGKLTAIRARILIDNGIFAFNHGGIMAMLLGGYYKCANVKIDTYEVHTHKPQVGAYRAPGAPQATFAIESQIDDLAHALGIDPLEFRLTNAAETGDPLGNNRPWSSLGLRACLERLRDHPFWQQRAPGPNEGVGIAIGSWPIGGSPAEAICRIDNDGSVRIQSGHVDVSGNNSSLVLIAAEILTVDPAQVVVENGNTNGPYAPGSGGSQVTYSVAGAVRTAAEAARQQLLAVAGDEFEASAEDLELADGSVRVRGVPDKTLTLQHLVGRARSKRGGRGPIVGEGRMAVDGNAPGTTVHAVKVRVDPATGRVTPLDYLAIQDVGFAINPLLVQGQMHGGMAQGLGMALHEALVYGATGQLLTGTLIDYGVPRSDDVPPLTTIALENPSPHGPFGARGIGEPPIVPGAAAIANAVRAAVGVRITEMPLRAERVWQALQSLPQPEAV